MAFFLPSGAHRINKCIGSVFDFPSLNKNLRCVVENTTHLFIAPMTQNTYFSGSFVLPLSLRTSAHTGVAIRNTHWEEADSHGHKCPLNDSFVDRHAKSNTPINRNLKSDNNRIKNKKRCCVCSTVISCWDQTARSTLLERRHLVQAYTWQGVPLTMALTRFTLGFQVLLERLWEWETLIPKVTPLPQ